MSQKLQKNLKTRHLVMIALGGSIGTGLFLASGEVIHAAGPMGAVLAYLIMAIIVYMLMCSLGEMASYSPTAGTFCEYCRRYVSPEFGFAMGWNYWFNWAVTVSAEIIAASFIMQYWFPDIHLLYWSTLFFTTIFTLNCRAVKIYGEIEYWLSLVKITFVVGFIIIGFSMIFGVVGNSSLLTKWADNTFIPFHNGLFGFMTVFLIAGFSFQGTEMVSIAAGEARNPEKSIPAAIQHTFWRLVIFYIFSIIVISALIPYTEHSLIENSKNIANSPFTVILKNAGFSGAATIMNALILVAILSACNASMYSATRIMWHLANTRQAPKVFNYINDAGIPINALIFSGVIGCFFFLTVIFDNGIVLFFLIKISSLTGFIAWFGIALSHFRFRRAYIKQGYDVKHLPYRAKWFPVAPIISMIAIIIIILGQETINIIQGTVIWKEFCTTYVGLIFFVLLLITYKITQRSSITSLSQCKIEKIH